MISREVKTKGEIIPYLKRVGFKPENKVGDDYYIFENTEIKVEVLFHDGYENVFGKYVAEGVEWRCEKVVDTEYITDASFESFIDFFNDKFKYIFRKQVISKLLNDSK